MPTSTFTHPLFGDVKFKTKHSVWIRGDKISFISGFDASKIKEIYISQLKNVPGANNGKLFFHIDGHDQLQQVFKDIEKLKLLKFIRSCGGTLSMRLRKPTNGHLSKLPSNHAFGTAIDLNYDDKALGATVSPVAPVFEASGFKWGADFNDPMHFEIEEFIKTPKSVAPVLAKLV